MPQAFLRYSTGKANLRSRLCLPFKRRQFAVAGGAETGFTIVKVFSIILFLLFVIYILLPFLSRSRELKKQQRLIIDKYCFLIYGIIPALSPYPCSGANPSTNIPLQQSCSAVRCRRESGCWNTVLLAVVLLEPGHAPPAAAVLSWNSPLNEVHPRIGIGSAGPTEMCQAWRTRTSLRYHNDPGKHLPDRDEMTGLYRIILSGLTTVPDQGASATAAYTTWYKVVTRLTAIMQARPKWKTGFWTLFIAAAILLNDFLIKIKNYW